MDKEVVLLATRRSDVPHVFPGVDATPLDEDDLFDVKSELTPVSADWRSIGIALRLQVAILNRIHAENGGRPGDCLTSMATEWLKRNYKVEKFGEPTWQRLVEAVGEPAGGGDMALARKIARRHKARVTESTDSHQPPASPQGGAQISPSSTTSDPPSSSLPPQQQSERGPMRKLDSIAAIDFGTTNCSVAYTTAGSRSEKPQILPLNTSHYRVPAAILFDSDGTVDSFGYDARKEYFNLDDEDRLKYTYFEQIKMNLQHDENVHRKMKIRANNGAEYYLMDVLAQVLKYLKNELIVNTLQRAGYDLKATDFNWVIAVPPTWGARGKKMMREAGHKAGLCAEETCSKLRAVSASSVPDEKELSLAPEHECAAIYCQSMSSKQQIAPYCPAEKSSCYLVVDIGGGTGDISVHRVLTSTPDQRIEVILHSLIANDWGGSRVNREFEKLLGKLVSDEKFSRYLQMKDQVTSAKNSAELNELVNEKFEKQKVTFGNKGGVGKKTTICLPFTFLDVYKDDIDKGIRRMKDARLKRAGESLRIEYSMMADFFQPVVGNIIQCVSQAIKCVEAMGKKVDTIYLVGGFGGSEYIRKRISEKFGETYKCIIPPDPNSAVIHGAVLFRQNCVV